jgi:cobalt/nickel transport system permease protein
VGAFHNEAARVQMARASGGVAPPAVVPDGMARLASLWTAPLSDYAPAFMHRQAFGYVMSAFVGTGLILLAFIGLSRLPWRGRSRPGS